MATVYSAQPTPTTPTKADLATSTSESAPDYVTPAPRYTKSAVVDVQAVESECSVDDVGTNMIRPRPNLKVPHPIYPRGEIISDVRTHWKCNQLFNVNVDVLVKEHLVIKADLETANAALAKSNRELHRERREKESFKRQLDSLQVAMKETQTDLVDARKDLAATQVQLGQSVSRLAETVARLESVKSELRTVTRERETLQIALADKQKSLDYWMARAAELTVALEAANNAENEANDRNTRLTELLYEIERKKASIERAKDVAEARVRELRKDLEDLRLILDESEGGALIIKLRAELAVHVWTIEQLNNQLSTERVKVAERDSQIRIKDQRIADLTHQSGYYLDWLGTYDGIVAKLHRKCRKQFPVMRTATLMDCTELPQFAYDTEDLCDDEGMMTIQSTDACATSSEPVDSSEPTEPEQPGCESSPGAQE